MVLFFVVLGGAAVLEVHRALHFHGNKDLQAIKRKEDELKRQLQDLQRELQQTRSQRELTAEEARQLAALNDQLAADKQALEAQRAGLEAANEELARRAEGLAERQAALERSEESLRQENANLLQQFDRLKIKYEEESASFHEQLAELKQQVSGALQRFAAGELSAEALLAFLAAMGVEVRCLPDELERLPDQLNSARSAEERMQLLDKVELSVDDSWVHQLRLSACPDRAARLLMNARSDAAPAGPSGAAALTYPQQPKKLSTPNKDGSTAGSKVPLLKLPSSVAAGPSAVAGAIEAAPALAQDSQPQAAQPVAAAPQLPAVSTSAAAPEPLRPVQDNRSKGLRFLPSKKMFGSSKARASLTTPRLEMDVPLDPHGSPTAAVKRLASGMGRAGGPGQENLGGEEMVGAGAGRALMPRP